MILRDKSTIWDVLCKYEGTLPSLCNSLSNILQGEDSNRDYCEVFGSYQLMDPFDLKRIDKILGHRILNEINV